MRNRERYLFRRRYNRQFLLGRGTWREQNTVNCWSSPNDDLSVSDWMAAIDLLGVQIDHEGYAIKIGRTAETRATRRRAEPERNEPLRPAGLRSERIQIFQQYSARRKTS